MLYYLFAIIGDRAFGGLVSEDSEQIFRDQSIPNNYVKMNFNDTLASFITLFALTVVNNWFVIVNVIVRATDNNLYKFFFILFYILSVTMILNIVVAFVIDIYSSVEELNDQKNKREETVIVYPFSNSGIDEESNEETNSEENSVRRKNQHPIRIGDLKSSANESSSEHKHLHKSMSEKFSSEGLRP